MSTYMDMYVRVMDIQVYCRFLGRTFFICTIANTVDKFVIRHCNTNVDKVET